MGKVTQNRSQIVAELPRACSDELAVADRG